jgi:hypothetical protein
MHLWLGRRRPARRSPKQEERRGGFRVALGTPVFVYGWLEDEPFSESTQTLDVSEFGGLISLSAKVVLSQELVLTNLRTDEVIPCRIARTLTGEDGRTIVGLAFLQASPNFWQVEFVSKRLPSSTEPHS